MEAAKATSALNLLLALALTLSAAGVFMSPSEIDQYKEAQPDSLDAQITKCMHGGADFDTCFEHLTD